MNYSSLICLAFLFMISCVPKNKGNYTLDDQTLFEVFKDVKVAEHAIFKQNRSIRDSLREVYQGQIEKLHDIPYHIIEQNLVELQTDSKKHKLFYERLRDTLSAYDKKDK